MLPYLGSEIIDVMQAAYSIAPNDTRSGPRLPFTGKGEDTIILSMALSFSLKRCNSRTLGVRHFWINWHP